MHVLMLRSTLSMACVSSVPRTAFFFNDTATTEIYTLSLHDALPIFPAGLRRRDTAHPVPAPLRAPARSEEHTSELQSHHDLVCRLLLENKNKSHSDHAHLQDHHRFVQRIRVATLA